MGRKREYSSESQQSPGATWGGDEPNERLTYQVDGKIGAYQANNGKRGIRVRFRRGSLRNGYHFQGRQQARKLLGADTAR